MVNYRKVLSCIKMYGSVCTHYAVGHQGSLHKACQDISRVVLVVGDT